MSVYQSNIYKTSVKRLAKEVVIDNKRILITGASGLIGSCIVDVFLCANKIYDKNNIVYVLGRSIKKLSNRFSYYKGDKLRFVEQDIIVPLSIEDKIDIIIHGASNADPRSYSLYPAETMITTIYGTTNMLNYCKENKECRILFLSTFEVYGYVNEENNQTEERYGLIDYNMVRSCYPESKRSAELLIRSYCEEYGVNALIARLSSVYGPTMSKTDNKAHAQFIRNGINGKDIVLKSKGEQRRTYTYLFDAVSGILHLLVKGKNSEVYNISNPNSIATIAEVAQEIAEICNTKVIYALPDALEKKGFSVPQHCVLISKKIEEIGWLPKYDLKLGLQETISILKEMETCEI